MERADRDPRWTLSQLLDRARRALEQDYRGPRNRQVQPLPSRRTLRYYTTLGLLDRPVEMRGRTALYGWRHLLQVVAVKRLQEEGLALVKVQRRMAGQATADLARIALLPERANEDVLGQSDAPAAAGDAGPADRGEDFWRRSPEAAEVQRPAAEWDASGLNGVSVDPRLALVWSGRAPSPDDLGALRHAARPLLNELQRRGLIGPRA